MRFELTTSTLARLRSTPELRPLCSKLGPEWDNTLGVNGALYSLSPVRQDFFAFPLSLLSGHAIQPLYTNHPRPKASSPWRRNE